MHATTLALLLCLAPGAELPIVVEDVDTIPVCHVADGTELLFIFGRVQGEWVCLDHRWLASDMTPGREAGKFTLSWYDGGDECYRVIRAAAWQESWESESPISEQVRRPRFVQACTPGLKKPNK